MCPTSLLDFLDVTAGLTDDYTRAHIGNEKLCLQRQGKMVNIVRSIQSMNKTRVMLGSQ